MTFDRSDLGVGLTFVTGFSIDTLDEVEEFMMADKLIDDDLLDLLDTNSSSLL